MEVETTLKIYLLRPVESLEAVVVVAESETVAQALAAPYGSTRYPNVTAIGIAGSGIHQGILVEGQLHVEPRG